MVEALQTHQFSLLHKSKEKLTKITIQPISSDIFVLEISFVSSFILFSQNNFRSYSILRSQVILVLILFSVCNIKLAVEHMTPRTTVCCELSVILFVCFILLSHECQLVPVVDYNRVTNLYVDQNSFGWQIVCCWVWNMLTVSYVCMYVCIFV